MCPYKRPYNSGTTWIRLLPSPSVMATLTCRKRPVGYCPAPSFPACFRFPKPCAKVRILPGAPRERPDQRLDLGHVIHNKEPCGNPLGILLMRGHLEDRGKDVWRAKVYAGRQGDGRRVYVTRTIHGTKRFAERKLAELLMEAGHTDEVTTDGTLADLVQQWRPIAEVNLSPTTLHEYDRLLEKRILPRFGRTKVRSIRAADIDAFYADLQRRGRADGGPLGAQSIHHVHALLRRLLNQAVRWGWIATSPVTRASPPRVHRHELAIPKPQVVAKLINEAEEKDSDLASFLRLAVVTGARRG